MLREERPINFRSLKFGIEIELTGIDRENFVRQCCVALNDKECNDPCSYTNLLLGHPRWRYDPNPSGYYRTIRLFSPYNREYNFMNDGSIRERNGYPGTEIVTPVLTLPDFWQVEVILAVARRLNARADKSCAVHIHCDSSRHSVASISRLINFWHYNEDFLMGVLNVQEARRSQWARRMQDWKPIENRKLKPKTKADLAQVWIGARRFRPSRYDTNRYHALNLNNLWRSIETIECRAFNASLNATKVRAYLLLWLGINAKCINSSNMAPVTRAKINKPLTRLSVLLTEGLGLKGTEFKAERKVLTNRLRDYLARVPFPTFQSR